MFVIKIGLLGLGTVGKGVYNIINNEKGYYFQTEADAPQIVKILVTDTNKDRGNDLDYSLLTTDPDDILLDNTIDIVVAVMGGGEPELKYVLRALNNKKHVVTANKQIISDNMALLLSTAKENNVSLMFEASVGGGIPIIDTMQQLLKINRINNVTGILNGTTNFILSQMSQHRSSFDDALKVAQQMGFAEADPTADVMGFDVSRKLSILSSLAYNHIIKDENIYKRGITSIAAADIEMTRMNGYVLKYVAQSFLKGDKYYTAVAPALIKESTELAVVNNEYNVIILNGNIIGEIKVSGKGAGQNPTANAVVGDIIYILEKKSPIEADFSNPIRNGGMDEFRGKYYFRFRVENSAQFSSVFDCVDKYVEKKDAIYQKGNLFFFTEEIASSVALKIENETTKICENIFFARVIE